MATISALYINLGIRTAGWVSGLNQAEKRIGAFGKNVQRIGDTFSKGVSLPLLAVGASASKFALDFDTAMTQSAVHLGKTADQTAHLRDSVLQLAGQTGQAPRVLAESLKSLTENGLSGAEAFKTLKIAAMSTAAGIGKLGSAKDILDGLAKTSLKDLKKAFEETSQSAGFKFHQALAKSQAVLITLGSQVLPLLLPPLGAMVAIMDSATKTFRSFSPEVQKGIVALGTMAAIAGPALSGIGRAIKAVAVLFSPLILSVLGATIAVALLAARWKTITFVLGGVKDMLADKVVPAFKDFTALVLTSSRGAQQLADVLRMLGVGGTAALNNVKDATIATGMAIKDEIALAVADIGKFAAAFQGLDLTGAAAMADLASSTGMSAADIAATMKQLQDAMNNTAHDIGAAARNISEELRTLRLSGLQDMGALAGSFAAGELSFKKFEKALLRGIANLIAQMAILKAAGAGLLGAGSEKFLSGFAGGLFGGFRAEGGPVSPGQAYMVGERRQPELFVPDTAGQIIPLSEMAGGSQGEVHMNVTQNVKVTDLSPYERRKILRQLADEIRHGAPEAVTFARRGGDLNRLQEAMAR